MVYIITRRCRTNQTMFDTMTRQIRKSAADMVESMAYDMIKSEAKLDTQSGHVAAGEARAIADDIERKLDEPIYVRIVRCGNSELKIQRKG